MGYQFPLYPVGDDETMDSFLYKRTMEGVSQALRRKEQRQPSQARREAG